MTRLTQLGLMVLFAGILVSGCKKQEKEEAAAPPAPTVRDVWTKAQANEWYKQWGWLRGADFIPSTAINQLEMWQAETFCCRKDKYNLCLERSTSGWQRAAALVPRHFP